MRDHPIRVVAARVGNTPGIALAHRLQTVNRDFDEAVQKAVQSVADGFDVILDIDCLRGLPSHPVCN